MLSNRQITKIAQKMYPSSAFSYKERIYLRQAAKEGITEYLAENPDATYEEIQQHYADSEISATMQESSAMYMPKIIICIGLLLAIVCTLLFTLSNGWTPPTHIV